MKRSILLALILFITLELVLAAGKNGNRGRKRKQRNRCIYEKRRPETPLKSQCTSLNQVITVTRNLNESANNKGDCTPTKVMKKFNCSRACKYERQTTKPDCDDERMRTITRTLKPNQPTFCPNTLTRQRACREKRGTKECRYMRTNATQWSACDATNQTSRILSLNVKKSREGCEPTKTDSRPCVCRYKRGEWSDCNDTTNLKSRTDSLNLRASPPSCQSERTKTRPCRARPTGKPRQQGRGRGRGGRGEGRTGNVGRKGAGQRTRGNQRGQSLCRFGSWGEYGPCENGARIKRRALIAGTNAKCMTRTTQTEPCE